MSKQDLYMFILTMGKELSFYLMDQLCELIESEEPYLKRHTKIEAKTVLEDMIKKLKQKGVKVPKKYEKYVLKNS